MSISSKLAPYQRKSTDGFSPFKSPQEAFAELCRLYDEEVTRISAAFDVFKGEEDFDGLNGTKVRAFYPALRIEVDYDEVNLDPRLSHGAFKETGVYQLNVTDPNKYHDLLGQMEMLASHSEGVVFQVGLSDEEIPLHYSMNSLAFNLATADGMTPDKVEFARRAFTKRIAVEIDDYVSTDQPDIETKLLLPYNGQRIDHARSQFFYYTRTPWEALQPFVIFSNYNQYVEDMFNHGVTQLKLPFNAAVEGIGVSEPHVVAVARTGHDVEIRKGYEGDPLIQSVKLATEIDSTKGAQMPSCHIMMSDGVGISLINTGVGSPNALTISDIIAPKRSHGWFMAGHCAGLSPTLSVGDYVFADNYFINPAMPNTNGIGFDYSQIFTISAPPSAEMQNAIKDSVTEFLERQGASKGVDGVYRRAAAVSTDYRFWERSTLTREMLQATNAAALDMETAYLAAKAREQSIPFSAYLKVSDLPHYDLPKSPAMTDQFFGALGPHLGVIIDAIGRLKEQPMIQMHSRKNRAVEGPKAFVMQ